MGCPASIESQRDGDGSAARDERALPLAALAGLLDEFRRGKIFDRAAEREGMEKHAGELAAKWDARFPGMPSEYFPYTSLRGEHYRGRRDEHLKDIIVGLLTGRDPGETVIVNPACVFGRHACHLASRLAGCRILATDIDPRWMRLYRLARGGRLPGNFSFALDNIFEPRVETRPTAVVFFGACGAVSDGAMDYAIDSRAPILICRTCCHDNIGGNVEVVSRPNSVNRFFRFKNWAYGRMKRHPKYAGYYFSDRYDRTAYPRSEAAATVTTSDELLDVARHSADSDICRTIIDLDRHLYLAEKGYSVLYQGELFVAERDTRTAR